MKLKKSYLFLIVIIVIIISITGFFLKKYNIKVSTIFNKTYKEAYHFNKNTEEGATNDCIDLSKSSNTFLLNKNKDGHNFKILDARDSNLTNNEGTTGYIGFSLLYDNCTYDAEAFFDLYDNNNELLDILENYIKSLDSIDSEIYNGFVYDYNNNYVKKFGSGRTPLPAKEDKHECSYGLYEETDETGQKYKAASLKFNGYVDINRGSKTYDKWIETWINNCGCNSNLKYFITQTSGKEVLNRMCPSDSGLTNTGYVTLNATDSSGKISTNCYLNGVWQNEGQCPFDCTEEWYNEIKNGNKTNLVSDFNKICTNLSKIEQASVILDWQDGDGPSTLGDNWKVVGPFKYQITGVAGSTHTVKFDKELVLYQKYKLKGWDTDPKCTNVSNSSGLNHTFKLPNAGETITYYACYDGVGNGDLSNRNLFNGDGSKKTGTTISVIENNKCNHNVVESPGYSYMLNNISSTYIRESYDQVNTSSNAYCNVLCSDKIEVKYPNIFPTVPAGQYFEFMYEPEINATRECKSQFNYSGWYSAYIDAINAEKEALKNYEEAKASLSAAKSLTPTSSANPNCGTKYACGTADNPAMCFPDYTYSDTKEVEYKSYTGDTLKATQSVSECTSQTATEKKDDLIESAEKDLASAKDAYISAITKRVNLEKNNLQCYQILDSPVSGNQKNDNVFADSDNYESVSKINYTYNVYTPRVPTPSDAFGTQSNYYNYIVNTESLFNTTNDLQKVNFDQISTKNFFDINPKLEFTYDQGSDGSPTNSSSSTYTDKLLTEALVKEDTGAYTSNDDWNYVKNDSRTRSITSNFNVADKGRENHISFQPYDADVTYRKVSYHFVFHEGTEFFSDLHTGNISKTKNSRNISLSKETKYTDDIKIKNHVYPISLKALAGKYQVSFNLMDAQTRNGYFSKNFKTAVFNNNSEYTCNYEITNDALILAGEKKTYKDLKSSTIFRPISTKEIDPNNRADSGNLGENWTNKKGLVVSSEIENTEGDSARNTYNPENLEYSFTLTPALIAAIKDYNKGTGRSYDDFNLKCATEDGRECTSSFLEDLANGKVEGKVIEPRYSRINSWGSDDLKAIRKKWKYYSENYGKGSIKNYQTLPLKNYLQQYESWGVLP